MKTTFVSLTLVLAVALSASPLALAQSTFSWNFTCQGSKFQQEVGFVSTASATWNWTANGTPENSGSGTARCNSSANQTNMVSVAGSVPANANGITVFVRAQTAGRTCTTSTSQPFSNKGTVSIKNLSVACHGVESGLSTFIEATFNLQS